jgi:hypothetical protein
MSLLKKIFKNEKGLAMPLILIIMVVLSLLGAAIWQYSVAELNHSVREEKKARAYYIARAGAESLGRHIMVNPSVLNSVPNIDDLITSDELDFDITFSGETISVGDLTVELERIETDRVTITGTGTVDEIVQSVSLILETQEPFDGVVYSMGSLDFQSQVNLVGDIVSGGKVTPEGGPSNFSGTIKEDTVIIFPPPDPDFPEVPAYSGNLNIPKDGTHTITTSPAQAYQKIDIGHSATLIINASSGYIYVEAKDFDMHSQAEKFELVTHEGNDIVLVVDEMVMKTIKVTGNGVAYVYVRSKLNVQTPHAEVDSTALLVVYLGPGAIMELQAGSHFEGLVYGPEAIVEIAGNADFHGAMIVEQLKGRGGSFTIGSAGTDIIRAYSWDILDLDYGGYWMVHWVR